MNNKKGQKSIAYGLTNVIRARVTTIQLRVFCQGQGGKERITTRVCNLFDTGEMAGQINLQLYFNNKTGDIYLTLHTTMANL